MTVVPANFSKHPIKFWAFQLLLRIRSAMSCISDAS
jgi:hypothetical protein